MKEIVKSNDKYYHSGLFTFQCVFLANFNLEDFCLLKQENNLIGLIISQKKYANNVNNKSYHFLYKGNIFNNKGNAPLDIYQKLLSDKKPGRLTTLLNNSYNISEIPYELSANNIFVFKIYELIKEKEQQKMDNKINSIDEI